MTCSTSNRPATGRRACPSAGPVWLVRAVAGLLVCLTGCDGALVLAQTPATGRQDSRDAILDDQSRLAEQYRLLEEKLFSLYQYEQDQNPDRARLLQDAYQQSREKLTLDQIRAATQMLQQSRFRDAEKNQATATEHLQQLLELLQSEDRNQRIREDLDRYREYLREVDRIMRIQQGVRGQAENARPSASPLETGPLPDQQAQIARRTADLQAQMADQEPSGQPTGDPGQDAASEPDGPDSTSPDPSGNESGETPSDSMEPGQLALNQARQNMQRARQALEKAQQDQAVEQMRAAEQQLAQAREELEKTLRQLREEEIARSLASLESRFRKMLELQLKIYDETQRLDLKFAGRQDPERGIQSNRLAASQRELVAESGRARLVLEDDGSSIATIEMVRQLGIDLQQIVDRLVAARTGTITQQIQSDVIETLGFLVEAFEQAQEDNDQSAQDSSGEGDGDQPGQQALVNRLAELKLIRSLQSRILNRHKRYASMLANPADPLGYSDDPDIRQALRQLADREIRLHQVTRDIVTEEQRRRAEQEK